MEKHDALSPHSNLRTKLMHHRFFPSRGFLSGAALASPFLAGVVSWQIAGWIIALWAVAGGATIRNFAQSLRDPLLILPALILGAHSVALMMTETPFASSVIKESLIACALLTIAFTSKRDPEFSAGFFAVVIGAALGTATLGLIKLGLQDRGYLLWFIIRACPDQYPQGSNLCADYNMLGMLWLAAAVGAVAWRIQRRSLAPLFLICLFIAAGLAIGSRRFLTLVLLVPILWVVLAAKGRNSRSKVTEILLAVIVCAASWLAVGAVSDPASFERFRFGSEPWTILGAPAGVTESVIPPNRAGAFVIAETILDEGLSSRFDKWRAGGAMFLQSPIIGQGFNYHEPFANEFVGGLYRDYPHLPLLSEAIIGGMPLFLVCFALYVMLALRTFSPSMSLQATGIPACFFIVTAISAISGDTIFSIPQWLSVALALAIVARGEDAS